MTAHPVPLEQRMASTISGLTRRMNLVEALLSDPVAVGNLLARTSLQSGNYAPGTTGWTVNADGTGEITIGIAITNGNYFAYTGPSPAVGTLSISVVSGTANVIDSVGNVALPGVTTYQTPLAANSVATNIQAGDVGWYSWNSGTSSWAFGPAIDWAPVNGFVEVVNAPFRTVDTSATSLIEADSWHTLTLNSATGTVQYIYEANGPCIRLKGEAILSANTAADFAIATIPYSFASTQDFVTPNNLSGYNAGNRVVRVAASGNLRIEPSGTSGNFVIFDGVVAALN